MLGGTEIMQDSNFNTLFIAYLSILLLKQILYFTWPFVCQFLLPHSDVLIMGWIFMKGSITVHTLSYATAVCLHISFCFTVRQYFKGGDYL